MSMPINTRELIPKRTNEIYDTLEFVLSPSEVECDPHLITIYRLAKQNSCCQFSIRSNAVGDCNPRYCILGSYRFYGFLAMNSSEQEWFGLPDQYEVEITEGHRVSDDNFNDTNNNATLTFQGNKIVVRPEEAFIVIFVLVLWVGAIGLFFHRWGKIRNCEPYAPKFEAEIHRGSCHDQANLINKRMSMSSKLATPGQSLQMSGNQYSFSKVPAYPTYNRSRQNSVFVSPHLISPPQPPRKYKSAMDLHSMISEGGECEDV